MEPYITTETPLVNQNYQLTKLSGKVGWTFAIIPVSTISRVVATVW